MLIDILRLIQVLTYERTVVLGVWTNDLISFLLGEMYVFHMFVAAVLFFQKSISCRTRMDAILYGCIMQFSDTIKVGVFTN